MIPVRVKICGITNSADAVYAASLGVHYLGLIFSKSPRKLTLDQARAVSEAVPRTVGRVGVFVDEDIDFVRRAVREIGLDLVQLHGNESPAYCERLEVPHIKVFRVQPDKERDVCRRIEQYDTGYCLLEPYVPGVAGGTGKTADWPLAGRIVKRFPEKRIFLAGGLSPHNIIDAARTVEPFGVDGNSGVETSPGVKDHEKLTLFIDKARSV